MEQLLARRLGRGQRVVRLLQQPVQQRPVHPAAGGQRPVRVVGQGSAAEPAGRRVDQRAARPGVEGGPVGRGEVGDTADVQRDGPARPAPQPQQVEQADQRGTLPAGGDVPRPEVGDHGQPGRLGDPGRLPELERAVHLLLGDPVVDGLPVRGHQPGQPLAQFPVGPDRGRREGLPDEGVQPAHLAQRGVPRRQGGGQGLAQFTVVRLADHAERLQHQAVADEVQVGHRRVDGVVRRPGHESDHPHPITRIRSPASVHPHPFTRIRSPASVHPHSVRPAFSSASSATPRPDSVSSAGTLTAHVTAA
ncbi:hypothetical protein SAFG77S_00220 [Streptomyces afghaniensis]